MSPHRNLPSQDNAIMASTSFGNNRVSPSQNPVKNPHRIIIVGGGAGGLELVTRLGDRFAGSKDVKIVLVDRSPTHLWKPLLHEVAAGSMDANTNQLEYIAQARWHHFEFQQGELASLDRQTRRI